MTRDDWNRRYAAADGPWSTAPHPLVPAVLGDLPPGRALDAACGDGRHACWLHEHGWQVTAIDFADRAIARGRARAPAVDWVVADVAHWSPPERSVDLVLVAFLHTPPADRALWMQGLREAVRPGGHLLYIGHDPSNVVQGHGGPRDPALLPSAADVCRALPGFEPLRAEVVTRRAGDDPGHGGPATATALDTLVFAVRRV